jgi:hypothetical protein
MMRSIESAFAVSVGDVVGVGEVTPGAQAVSRTSVLIAAHTRPAKVMVRILAEGDDLGPPFHWHAGRSMNDSAVLLVSLLVVLVVVAP